MSGRAVLLLTFLLLGLSAAEDVEKGDREGDFKPRSISRDCTSGYSMTCFKLDLVSWIDKLNEGGNWDVLPGISVVREDTGARSNTGDIVAELAREFPDDPEARLDNFLLRKVQGFMSGHSLKLNLWDNSAVEQARGGGGGGGGGGGKKGGGMGIILAMGAMWKAALAAIALKGLALLAGKALLTALVSLVLSVIIGLKALHHHGHHSTHEVIAAPVHHHEDYHGHYRRSYEVPLPLGLQPDYKPIP